MTCPISKACDPQLPCDDCPNRSQKTLLQYVIAFLLEELNRGQVDQFDPDSVRRLMYEALDAWEGGAR